MQPFFRDFVRMPKYLFFRQYLLLPAIVFLVWIFLSLVLGLILNRPDNLEYKTGDIENTYKFIEQGRGKTPTTGYIYFKFYDDSTTYRLHTSDPRKYRILVESLHWGSTVEAGTPKRRGKATSVFWLSKHGDVLSLKKGSTWLINSREGKKGREITLIINALFLMWFGWMYKNHRQEIRAYRNAEATALEQPDTE